MLSGTAGTGNLGLSPRMTQRHACGDAPGSMNDARPKEQRRLQAGGRGSYFPSLICSFFCGYFFLFSFF